MIKPVLQPAPDNLDGMRIIYRDSEGNIAKKVVRTESPNGGLMFFELLGQSGLNGIPNLTNKGKKLYRRLMIKQVYPYINKEDLNNEN